VAEIDESSGTVPGAGSPPSPDTPSVRATFLEILLCSGYPTQIIISSLMLTAGIRPEKPDGGLNVAFILPLLLADTALLIALILFFIRRRGERPREVFFGATQPLQEIATGMISFPTVIVIVVALTLGIRRLAPELHNVPDNPLAGLLGDQMGLWLFLIVGIVAGGIREELQRAFLLQRFRTHLGQPWLGLLITSLAFGIGHSMQGKDAVLITGALGAFWGFLYLSRGGAIASMVSHSLFNSGELLIVFLR
jgi:membrane protease YdiL (CAAX protease family)